MIKPVGSDELKPLFVYDVKKHDALRHEAESLPSIVVSSAAAANAVMLGSGYFSPLPGYALPVSFFLNPDRFFYPPLGMAGGENGPLTRVFVDGDERDAEEFGSGQITLESPGDELELHLPGGGGFGPPEARDPEMRAADERAGLVAPERVLTPADDD